VADPLARRCPCGAMAPAPSARPDAPAFGLAPAEFATCSTCGRVLVIADPNVGRVFLGKWRILRRLGQGGMGTVYLAEDQLVGREVALKFLDGTLAQREDSRSRFVREATVMARVEHPNLASLYGVEHDGDAPFLVMRFVRGAPLSRVMARGPLSLDQALPVVAQLTSGLTALHTRGFVHRDLKPGNVMLSDESHVTLLDFGLTRGTESTLTRPGVTLGSPRYMSPEQILGGAIDARTDLYALALITSELLTGRRPYPEAAGAEAIQAHLFSEPERADVANSAVPRAVADVLLTALAKRPAERFPTALAFFEAVLNAARPGAIARLTAREEAPAIVASLANSVPHLPEVAEVIASDTVSIPLQPAVVARPKVSSPTEPDLSPPPERVTGPRPQGPLAEERPFAGVHRRGAACHGAVRIASEPFLRADEPPPESALPTIEAPAHGPGRRGAAVGPRGVALVRHATLKPSARSVIRQVEVAELSVAGVLPNDDAMPMNHTSAAVEPSGVRDDGAETRPWNLAHWHGFREERPLRGLPPKGPDGDHAAVPGDDEAAPAAVSAVLRVATEDWKVGADHRFVRGPHDAPRAQAHCVAR